MQRLSRAESQERTRTLIVEAATKLFLRDGFRTTSLEAVAEEAGFTRGAVYSNFANKTAMGIAVVDGLYAHEMDRVVAAVTAVAGQGMPAMMAALAAWGDSIIGDKRWARLEAEIAAFSAHDGTLRQAGATRHARVRATCVQLLVRLERDYGLQFPVDAETIAIGLLGLALGIGMQRAADPTIPESAFVEMADVVLAGLTGAGLQRSSG